MQSVANDPCYGRLGEREGAWRIATGRIGWIGTGQMGAALVTRLLKAAYDVAVYRRTRAKAEALAALEAAVVDSPTGLADRDVVFTMVSGGLICLTLRARRVACSPQVPHPVSW
jgi:glutamyl-tRNA reductase